MKSLRLKLFLWYLGSLLILTAFFYIVVHILAVPNATRYFLIILLILAGVGALVIYWVNGLLNQLQSSLKREQQFINDVAHELKTPLSTMRATLELALEREKNPVMKEAITEIDRLSRTLKDVLELAWSEASLQNRPKEFDLSALMEELSEIGAKMATSKKIKISQIIDKDIKITGLREKLARAILNILENSVKYSFPEGKVEISLEKFRDKILIVIKDNGPGIEKKELSRIFERFYRGSKTDKILGSGLGLAISKSIVEQHHGEIKVKSKPKEGSTFAIILPV